MLNNRIFYLDHLRVFLTILVLLHHAALPYTLLGGVWYVSDVERQTIVSSLLSFFIAINQAYFMGFFFYLSGYFNPASYDRKTPELFIKDRLLRLGIPVVVYLFILSPVVQYMVATKDQSFWSFYKTEILTLHSVETGPIWFAEVLLIFTMIYVLFRVFAKKNPIKKEESFPTSKTILLTALILGICTFTVRLVYPIGFWIWGIHIAYLPSYIFFFFIGIVAGRKNWLNEIPRKTTKQWVWFFAIVAPLFPLSLIFFNSDLNGGFNVLAFLYSIWEPLIAFGICIGLIALFRKYANQQGSLWKFLSRSAFTVYIIHPIILVGYTLFLKGSTIHPLLKFTTVGVAGTITSFLIASVIVKIPYVNKIV